MNRRSILRNLLWMATIGLLMAACSTDEDEADEESGEEESTTTVSFHLDTRGSSTRSADSDTLSTSAELQTEEEMRVTKVLVVVFRDYGEHVSLSGETDTDRGTETFYACASMESVSEDTPLDATTVYQVQLENEGHYQICFVANPSDALETAINSLTYKVSRLSDFKAIVADQEPDDKPMLMMSKNFYGIISPQDTELGIVTLTRIMSRIDIVNIAEGITIDGATMSNRTVKSLLVNDSNRSLNTDYLEQQTATYTFTLVGNPYDVEGTSEDEAEEGDTINALKSTIYSYEQYGTGEYIPVLTLTYHTDSNPGSTYSHDIRFVTTDAEGNETPICLARNTYYKICVGTSTVETASFSLNVADWRDTAQTTEVVSQ